MTTNDPLTDDTRPDDTMTHDTPTHDTPTDESTAAATAPLATTAPPAATAPTAPAEGPWLPGPAPFAIVLGILGLLLAGATLLTELTDLRFPWADLGPWTVVAAGLVVVLVGAIGLRSSRRPQA